MYDDKTAIDYPPIDEPAVLDIIRKYLDHIGRGHLLVTTETHIYGDDKTSLNLNSLETAELSVFIEDALGVDPFSVGLLPRTVGNIVDYTVRLADYLG